MSEASEESVHSAEDSQQQQQQKQQTGLSPRQISESISQIGRTRHLNPPVGATGRAERQSLVQALVVLYCANKSAVWSTLTKTTAAEEEKE